MTKSGGCRFACPGLRRSLGFQPAWVVRAIRYHLLFSPLGLSGTRRVPHALDMRKICGNPRDLWATTKRTMLKNRQNVFVLPRISQISTDTMRGAFIKKHGYHRCARMGLFTDCLLLLRCLPLGFDAPSAQRIATDFFACGRCAAERKICGNPRDLWATTKRTMLKNRQNVFILPRISQISTDAMRGACQ